MLDARSRLELQGFRCGIIARHALNEGAHGSIRAVFARCVYVELNGQWICVGSAEIGAGPLNLICRPWPNGEYGLCNALLPGDSVHVSNGILHLARSAAIALRGCAAWEPIPLGAWDRHTLTAGLNAFGRMLPEALPSDGLAQVIAPNVPGAGVASTLTSAAEPAVRSLEAFIERGGSETNTPAVACLVGLGPGLTPSGDDYLCGTLIALSLTKEDAARDALWRSIEPSLADRTHEISRAHLAAAAKGLGAATLHELLRAIITGRTSAIAGALGAATQVGHTSGWDALAGAVSALRSLARRSAQP
jgi:hypothetical protein